MSTGKLLNIYRGIWNRLRHYYLAEKYDVQGLKNATLNRLRTFPVHHGNYGIIVEALLNYTRFDYPCQVLENIVIEFIKNFRSPLDLVKGSLPSKNDKIKQEFLNKLAISVNEENLLQTVKAFHEIVKSEGFKMDENKAVKSVMIACARTYKTVRQDPVKFINFLPDPAASDLQGAVTILNNFCKTNYCNNCMSAACKKGEEVKDTEARVGCKVMVDSGEKGVIREVAKGKIIFQTLKGYFFCSNCFSVFDPLKCSPIILHKLQKT